MSFEVGMHYFAACNVPCMLFVCVESLRAIAETFHAAKKMNDEEMLITETKLDKYGSC